MEKARLNEIGFGFLLRLLSKEPVELNPDKIKREIGNLVSHLERAGVKTSKEEVYEALKLVVESLVNYAFNFSWKEDEKEKKKAETK